MLSACFRHKKVIITVPSHEKIIKHTHTIYKIIEGKKGENDHKHHGEVIHKHLHEGHVDHIHKHKGHGVHDHQHHGHGEHEHKHVGHAAHAHKHIGHGLHEHKHTGQGSHDHKHTGVGTHGHKHIGQWAAHHKHVGHGEHDHKHLGHVGHDHGHTVHGSHKRHDYHARNYDVSAPFSDDVERRFIPLQYETYEITAPEPKPRSAAFLSGYFGKQFHNHYSGLYQAY